MFNQFVIWLTAGLLDVRAERTFAWPEKQEIGTLRLDFVRISRKAGRIRRAIIEIAPLVAGIFIVWLVANSVLDVSAAIAVLNREPAPGGSALDNLGAAVRQLTGAPAFWLWVYFVFTVTNAMMPDERTLRGWAWGIGLFSAIVGFLFLLGVGGDTIDEALFIPVINGLNALTGVFALMIVLDLLAVSFLGLLESTIEWITGDTATFENGKMVTMTRAEALERRRAARRKAVPAAMRLPGGRAVPALEGAPSVYKFEFPTPGPPGREPVSQSASSVMEAGDAPRPTQQPLFNRPKREEPDIITATATRREDDRPSSSPPDQDASAPGADESEPTPDATVNQPTGPVIRTPAAFRQQSTGEQTPETGKAPDSPPKPATQPQARSPEEQRPPSLSALLSSARPAEPPIGAARRTSMNDTDTDDDVLDDEDLLDDEWDDDDEEDFDDDVTYEDFDNPA